MIRLLWTLFLIYLVFRAIRYFFRMFSGYQKEIKSNPDKRDVIDIDYEEISEDSSKVKK